MTLKQFFQQSPSKAILFLMTGPWMIPFWGCLCALYAAVGIAVPAEAYQCPEWNLFFQGDTDWGGGKVYAAIALALLLFAIIGPVHAVLRFKMFPAPCSYFRRLARTLRIAMPFFIVFIAVAWKIVGLIVGAREESPEEICSAELDVIPLFFSALLVNIVSVAWVSLLEGFRISHRRKILLAPMAAYLWFALAAGGQTPRAGQMLEAGWAPLPAVRGVRHQVLLTWHRHILSLFHFHLPVPPSSSSLYFWTDGQLEFGRHPERSPSAKSLQKRESLPWLEGRTAYVVPVQVNETTPFRELVPYQPCHRHHRGYFLDLPEGPVQIVEGNVEPNFGQFPSRDVFLKHGALYLSISWHSGRLTTELRQLDLSCDSIQVLSTAKQSCTSSQVNRHLPPKETIPVEISIPLETQYSQITNLLLQLKHDGYRHVFIRSFPHWTLPTQGQPTMPASNHPPSPMVLVPMVSMTERPLSQTGVPKTDVVASDTIADFADANRGGDDGGTFSELNQLMDELLDLPVIPADYGATMVALYRDRTQDDITRDFAVQHIGLYAQALNRSGAYAPGSDDARQCRAALLDAADETRTIIAAAAFRALADISAFDPHIDDKRLDAMLVSCVGDASASSAARIMAIQLCGERRVSSALPALKGILDDATAPIPHRHAAKWALSRLTGDSQ